MVRTEHKDFEGDSGKLCHQRKNHKTPVYNSIQRKMGSVDKTDMMIFNMQYVKITFKC